ncbi:helix-turn-helix domain-containing protein [Lunatimonas salinarum]|uniref:helix-turn-helix domain-containing protein n=1 Tax=Lunatimonas salinarum TaxID=1774590 RepID=UPI001ADF83DD|nr:helix-turn-helix transcriptional regulator [Lunatimonas salinarum]
MDKITVIISNLRKEKGWSQSDLANESGVSREMISKYERGLAIPSVDAAKKIADAFGVSLDYLVGEGINASFDKTTLKRLQEIQNMKPDFRVHLFSVIDSVIRDYKTQQAYSQ